MIFLIAQIFISSSESGYYDIFKIKKRDVLPFPKHNQLFEVFIAAGYGNLPVKVINLDFLLLESKGQCQY